jgi:hypothetical protein
MLSGVAVSQPALRPVLELFGKRYQERYFGLVPERRLEEVDAWLPVVAAVRLSDNIPEIEDWLLTRIRAGLAEQRE